ncbi:cysteine desulfurase family protein [Hydrogenophaga sp. NFH-34]|uniref:cysteine desulfurase family protein n=1 Tax=Hydrogenophaga sp. NFH-34 TaxID=2744446 RepID=UPI001F1B7AEA|nr:cysteine desulfurase family protein [Hydrogenophaga sp. NFH-34]
MIYLDANATTPPSAAAVQAVAETLQAVWANPSSPHGPGQQARRVLGQARASVAQVLGCRPHDVVFTSGATEANHLALRGLLAAAPAGRSRLLVSAVEHAGLLRLVQALAGEGWRVEHLPVRPDGTADLAALAAGLGPDVALVSFMAANNETGVCMPVAEIAALAHAAGALFHTDATQCVGKQAFQFADSGADAATLSAHKFHGPKGVGALLLRPGTPFRAPVPGSQERGRRGGTENLPGIAGMAAALQGLGDLAAEAARQTALRDALEAGLCAALPATHIWARGAQRLPGTSLLRVGALSADVVLHRLERLGVAAASGAACASSGSEPSHVLRAMGVPADEALGAVRLSLGRTTTADEVRAVLAGLPPLLQPLLAPEALSA